MKKSEKKLNQAELARFYELNPTTIRGWVKDGCPCEKKENRLFFDLRDVVLWKENQWEKRLKSQTKRQKTEHEIELEKIHLEIARNKLAREIRLEEIERGEIMSRTDVRELLVGVSAHIRGAGEILARVYDDGAREIITEALDEIGREIAKIYKSD